MSEPAKIKLNKPNTTPGGKKMLSPIQVIEEEDIQSQDSDEKREEPLQITEEENSNRFLIQCLKDLAFFSKKHEI